MHVSLNELMLTCQKAGRGSGVSEGAAEDLGTAAVWLALHGLPAVEGVYHAVAAVKGGTSVYGEIDVEDGSICWGPGRGKVMLSAALVAAAAADLFSRFAGQRGCTLRMSDVDVPLLQLAYFSAATPDAKAIRIRWSDENAAIDFRVTDGIPRLISRQGAPATSGRYEFEVFREDSVIGSIGGEGQAIAENAGLFLTGLEVEETIWAMLKSHADLILVEPTARSRALGAGAGLSDND